MKIVINDCYGGFGLTDEALKALGAKWSLGVKRDDPRLVEMVEKDADSVGDKGSSLAVVFVPDEATDWFIDEYDGVETVYYVLDGKIHVADYVEEEEEEEND